MTKSKLENGEVIEELKEKYQWSSGDLGIGVFLKEDLQKGQLIKVIPAWEFLEDALNQQRSDLVKQFRKFMFTGGSPDRQSLDEFLTKLEHE